MPLTVRRGYHQVGDIRALLQAGSGQDVDLNTAPSGDRSLSEKPQRCSAAMYVVAIDAKRVGDHWKCLPTAGRHPTASMPVNGRNAWRNTARERSCSQQDRDGTKVGYDLELTRAISERVDIPVIASGGVGNLEHIYDGSPRAKPAPPSLRRSFTSASTPSPTAKTICKARRSCPCPVR